MARAVTFSCCPYVAQPKFSNTLTQLTVMLLLTLITPTVHTTLDSAQWTVYSAHFSVHSVQYAVYTVYNTQPILCKQTAAAV